MKISAVVLTKNEEKNIEECIESLKWCDEIVVIDDFSKDKTVDIAHKLGAKVYQRKLDNDFSSQRNFGLDKAKEEWVLFIDADERVSQKLAEEIQKKTRTVNKRRQGFEIRREDILFGKHLRRGEWGDNWLLRLGRKRAGRWKRRVHEYWDIPDPDTFFRYSVSLNIESPLLHYPHPTLREFVADIERYSTIHAEENYKEGKRSNLFKIIWYPKLKFFQNCFLKLGFLDGPQGFMVAMLMSFHSYLAWSKLWTIQKMKNEK